MRIILKFILVLACGSALADRPNVVLIIADYIGYSDNLAEDGTKLNDLASKMPEKVAGLESEHKEWVKRTDLSKKKKKP